LMYRLGGIYERMQQYDKALDILDAILVRDPEARDIAITGFQIARGAGLTERARRYLTSWLSRHPNDEGVRKMLDSLGQGQ